jgi:hypothetical protein
MIFESAPLSTTNQLFLMGGAGMAFLILTKTFDFILTLLRVRKFGNGNGNGNGIGKEFARSGDLPKEFWQLEFRKILVEVVTPLMKRQEELMEKQAELIEQTNRLLNLLHQGQELGKAHGRI